MQRVARIAWLSLTACTIIHDRQITMVVADAGVGVVADAGVDAPPLPSDTLHVDGTRGDDANAGDSTRPLRTLKAAIEKGRARAPTATTIRVCAGTYDEADLVVDGPLTLEGGYDCQRWARSDAFGYTAQFRDVNETILRRSAPVGAEAESADTLVLSGAASIVVEGFTIAGASGATASRALLVTAPSAILRDLKVTGGTPDIAKNVVASRGLHLIGSKAEVWHCEIHGGGGKTSSGTPSVGSIGVDVSGGAPDIHDNRINGGAGTGFSGTMAVRLADGAVVDAPTSFRDNTVTTDGGTTHGSGQAQTLVHADGASAVIERTSLFGGTADCTITTTCGLTGIFHIKGTLRLAQSVLRAGDFRRPGATPVVLHAIYANSAQDAVVENNVISLGGEESGAQGSGTLSAQGVRAIGSGVVRIFANTIFTGQFLSIAGTYRHAIATRPTSEVEGNLIVGGANDVGINAVAWSAFACDSEPFAASFRHNALVAVKREVLWTPIGTCTIAESPDSIAATQVLFPSNVSDNVALGDVRSQLFRLWVQNSKRKPEIYLTRAESPFERMPPCSVVQGIKTKLSSVTTDLIGTTRTLPSTYGAVELDLPCTP